MANGGDVDLTFDDGPSEWTPLVLDLLERYGATATFYVRGREASANHGIVREAHRRGHVIGNHSYSHMRLPDLPAGVVARELAETSWAVRLATGEYPTLFRPPYGDTSPMVDGVARSLGMEQRLWDVDPEDWRRPGVPAIVRALLEAPAGATVLLHDGGGDRSQTVLALAEYLATVGRG